MTINPALVLGPVLGSDFSASLEAIKKLLDGSLPALPLSASALWTFVTSPSCTCWR